MPDGIKAIGQDTYMYSDIETVETPNTLIDIGERIFEGCKNLKTIYCRAKAKPEKWHDNWNSRVRKY